jgi:hypothetical protein
VDAKTIKGSTEQDLLQAILQTIPDTMTLQELSDIFNNNQEKCLLIIDGFDEASYESREAVNLLLEGNKYRKATVVVLSRPEAKTSLKVGGIDVTEFTIDPLTMEQVENFIKKQYPFQSAEQRDLMWQECMRLEILSELVIIPIYLVMLSGLFDNKCMSSNLKEGADIYLSSLAMMFKTEVMKDETLKPKEMETLTEMTADELIRLYQLEIASFGYAIFRNNGNVFDAYEDLPLKELKTYMMQFLDTNADDKRIVRLLRLDLCDTIAIVSNERNEKMLRFFHRNFRDMVVGFGIIGMMQNNHIDGKNNTS